ncbi:hypothetical protein [Calidifontibacillus erzurumensis]|uniref:hypothetical protein n=1 Tax=Calidifontibacillus erzurumensis TaxID=2741433 RepID=UPI0035B4FF52
MPKFKCKWNNSFFNVINPKTVNYFIDRPFKLANVTFNFFIADRSIELLMRFEKLRLLDEWTIYEFTKDNLTFLLQQNTNGELRGWFAPIVIHQLDQAKDNPEWYTYTEKQVENMINFHNSINPKPKGIEKEQILSAIQMRKGGRLWFALKKWEGISKEKQEV